MQPLKMRTKHGDPAQYTRTMESATALLCAHLKPCLVAYTSIIVQQDATIYSLLYFCKLAVPTSP